MFAYLIRDVDNFYKVGGAMLDTSTNKQHRPSVGQDIRPQSVNSRQVQNKSTKSQVVLLCVFFFCFVFC